MAEGADGEHGLDRCWDMDTVTAVIAGRRDDQHATLLAEIDGTSEQGVWITTRNAFATADVDDLGTFIDAALDRSCEIELREVSAVVTEHWSDHTAAPRRQTEGAVERLAEHHTGDVSTVCGHRPRTCLIPDEGVDTSQAGTAKTWMAQIDWTVEDRHAYVGVRGNPIAQRPDLAEDHGGNPLARSGGNLLPSHNLSHGAMLLVNTSADNSP